MRNQRCTFVLWVILGASLVSGVYAKDTAAQVRENKIKAAFLYNFLKFVDWPENKIVDSNDVVVLSIIGETSFGDAFDEIRNKTVHDKKLTIKYFPSYEKLWQEQKDEIVKSQLLYIARSEKDDIDNILSLVEGHSVLTVADIDKFLEHGGHINFIVTEKVNFEINLSAAKRAGLQLRAQLLKVALRVIEEKDKSTVTNTPNLFGKFD